jgi:NADPH:quinone reductase-like Zn-dependent oxidoreductase
MRAALITRHGGPEVIELHELPVPEPGPGEVRVAVKAAALNHLDLWVRRGMPGLNLALPHVPAADICGIVDALGPGVVRCAPGDAVVLYPAHFCGRCAACLEGRQNHCPEYAILGEHAPGGLAEFIVVPERLVFPRPLGLGFEEGAAVPLAWLTSWHMLARKARPEPGDWVLVQAGASGTGVAAIQIARLFGARVIATAGSEEKRARLLKLGVESALLHGEAGLRAEVKRLSGGRGCTVVVDHVGRDTFRGSLSCLARGGRLVTCGGTSGADLSFDVRHLFIKHQQIIGSTMGDVGDFQALLGRMGPAPAAFALRPFSGEPEHGAPGLFPVIHQVFALDELPQAQEELESRRVFGKVVIRMG